MITFCTSEEFTLQIEGVGRTEYNIILTQEIGKDLPVDDIVTELSENPVKSSGIWSFVKNQIDTVKNWATNLFLKKSDEDKGSAAVEGHEQEYNHNAFLTSVPPIPSSAISHKDSTVAERLDNITAGSIACDVDGNITGITTFGEATTINRDVDGNITGWENDTHVWTLTKTNGEISGWTLTEKP